MKFTYFAWSSLVLFIVTMCGEVLIRQICPRAKEINTHYNMLSHTEPQLMANRLMSLSNINMYMTCIFVYQCLNGCVPDIFYDFYTSNRNIHGRDTRQESDLHVPYGRLDIRQNSMKIHEANMWNSIPENIKMSESIYLFKQRLRNFFY